MRRPILPVLLVAAFSLAIPLAAVRAQSTATTTDQRPGRSWTEYKGWNGPISDAQEKWSKLTDDDIRDINGRRDVLIAKLQARYAIKHEDAERQVGAFEARRP